MTVALLVLAFLTGAYTALVIRAMVADAAQRRIQQAAENVLGPEQLERLRTYIGQIDEHERERVGDDLIDANARLIAKARGTQLKAKRLLRDGKPRA